MNFPYDNESDKNNFKLAYGGVKDLLTISGQEADMLIYNIPKSIRSLC